MGGGTLQRNYYYVDVTIYAPLNQPQNAIIRIDDKDVNKTTIRPIDVRRMTVHRDFSVQSGHTIVVAESERNQRISNPQFSISVSVHPLSKETSKELLCDLYEQQLIVDAGTFEKILKAFNLIPDPVELLLFE